MAHVLVVEDEPNIGSIIVFKLKREGHQVRWEQAGATVNEAIRGSPPDLVLLDASLPDVDLFEVLTALRSIPTVVMTEFRDTQTPPRAMAAGARATLQKPFKPTQLARLVSQLTPSAPR